MSIARRAFIGQLGSFVLTSPLHSKSTREDRYGFRVFFNDDTTHLITLSSPYHERGQDIDDSLIQLSVDEAINAGVDTYVSEPGTGWVPLWKSKICPADQHYKWVSETYSTKISGLGKYMIEGGDVTRAVLNRCRVRGIPMIASLRLNDIHSITFSGKSLEYIRSHINDPQIPNSLRSLPLDISRIHAEQTQWRFDAMSGKPVDQIWDWGQQGPVEYKLSLAKELVTNYDVDGIELDFMRFPRFFHSSLEKEVRIKIMTRFIRDIREALDARRFGRDLCLRVPPKLGSFSALGLDLGILRDAGVTRLNLSHHTFTSQDVDVEEIATASHNIQMTLEIGQAKHELKSARLQKRGNSRLLPASAEDMISTVAMAKARKFDSISLFNFVYTRLDAKSVTYFNPGFEPPFHLINEFKSKDLLKNYTHSWFLSKTFSQGFEGLPQVPIDIAVGKSSGLLIYTVISNINQNNNAILRLDAYSGDAAITSSDICIFINGHPLVIQAEPYEFGIPENVDDKFLAFKFPVSYIIAGFNSVKISNYTANTIRILICEILISPI